MSKKLIFFLIVGSLNFHLNGMLDAMQRFPLAWKLLGKEIKRSLGIKEEKIEKECDDLLFIDDLEDTASLAQEQKPPLLIEYKPSSVPIPAPTPAPPAPPQPAFSFESVYRIIPSLKQFLKDNTGACLITATAIIYTIIAAQLWRSTSRMHSEETWAAWQRYLPVERLIMDDLNRTTEQLIASIKKEYLIHRSTDDFHELAQMFFDATKKEMDQLKSFVSLHEWLDFLMLDTFFPDQYDARKQAKILLIKLEYMRELVGDYLKAPEHRAA